MSSYVVRRLLLMVPTLFAISFINFAIVNMAPVPHLSNVSADGVFDTSASSEANESDYIFRQTFFLDRPIFFNTRYGLEDGEIAWRVAAPLRPWALPVDKLEHIHTLADYGRQIVPHLIRLAEPGALETVREDYEKRWSKARARWMEKGRPPGEIEWPPPKKPPAFDEAMRTRFRTMVLGRLANNAPRRPVLAHGDDLTDEIRASNREVLLESVRLRRIWADRSKSDDDKLALWKKWYADHEEEWNYSFGDKVSMLFLETRFAKFWGNLFTLDLGTSFQHRKKVWDLIAERIPISLTLAFGSLVIAYLLSVPLGILSAVTHRSWGDRVLTVVLFALYSVPTMFLGVLLLQYLALKAGWFPVSGFRGEQYADLPVLGKIGNVSNHLALPVFTMTVGQLAALSRYMKSGLIETWRADFVRTARAKGLSEFVVVMKHAVRNSLIPVITLLGAALPVMIGGSILVEFIFGIDGMGKLAYDAVVQRDYQVILGLNILTAVLTMVGIFLADLLYAIVDPRVSYK